MSGRRSRAERNIRWIMKYCLHPSGPDRGKRVVLTREEKETIHRIYDRDDSAPVTPPLSAYLALLHVCGPEALQENLYPQIETDIFTVWGAVSPELRAVLKHDGSHIVCPEIGTRFPKAA